jgi:ABC-type multidrug transport system fused ATPase/permease subunit
MNTKKSLSFSSNKSRKSKAILGTKDSSSTVKEMKKAFKTFNAFTVGNVLVGRVYGFIHFIIVSVLCALSIWYGVYLKKPKTITTTNNSSVVSVSTSGWGNFFISLGAIVFFFTFLFMVLLMYSDFVAGWYGAAFFLKWFLV